MQLTYPYAFDGKGLTSTASDEDHVRQMIEQVLFTSPGERVNRPTFGSGLLKLVFAPNGDVTATAAQVSTHAALQQWLGDVIAVQAVDVVAVDDLLTVTVRYVLRVTQQPQTATFTQTLP